MTRKDEIWKTESSVRRFLDEVRGGIPLAAEQIDVMLRLIEATGEPVGRFADLGCGNGVLAAAILDRHPNAHGALLDFSEPMLEDAQVKLSDHASRIQFVRSDFAVPEWVRSVASQAPFDVIVSGLAIHHQPDDRKRELYREIFDLLRPGGLFVNLDHVSSSTEWIEATFVELYVDYLHAFHTRTDTGKTRDQLHDEYVNRPDRKANILAPVEAQCDWLRDIGFQDVDCYLKILELAVFGGRRPSNCD